MTAHEDNRFLWQGEYSAEEILSRLGLYEELHRGLLAELAQTGDRLESLRASGQNKSVTFHQLLANKLRLQGLIARFEALGL